MQTAQRKILVVEDEDDERELMASKLMSEGYVIKQAKNGEEALHMIPADLPDLIVADVMMPVMDGGKLLKKLRETYYGRDIPFVIVSAREHMRDYFETLGVDAFLVKPFRPENLLQTVADVLNKPRQEKKLDVGKRVLVVGREISYVEKMTRLLDKEKCHTDHVVTSEQVISKAVMFLPNLIIIEAQMPGIQTSENIRILRQMPQFKKVPILIYSFCPLEKKESDDINLKISIARCLDDGGTEYVGHFAEDTFITSIDKYLRKAEVVIIDDDRGLVQWLKVELGKEGYKVEAAPDGEKGLELVRKEHPNVVLLDVILPGIIGYDVLGRMKNDPLTKEIPVIMMTVKDENNAIQKALDLGADDYIIKPFHMGLLKRRIQSWVNSK